MPSTSESQRRAAGMALAAKRGQMPKSELKGAAKDMMETMTMAQLKEFASSSMGRKGKK